MYHLECAECGEFLCVPDTWQPMTEEKVYCQKCHEKTFQQHKKMYKLLNKLWNNEKGSCDIGELLDNIETENKVKT